MLLVAVFLEEFAELVTEDVLCAGFEGAEVTAPLDDVADETVFAFEEVLEETAGEEEIDAAEELPPVFEVTVFLL